MRLANGGGTEGVAHVMTASSPRQGLALINGTQMITSLGAEAVERAQAIARQADIIAALTLEVLKGTTKAFDSGERRRRHGTVAHHSPTEAAA